MIKQIIWLDDDIRLMQNALPLFEQNNFDVTRCNTITAALTQLRLRKTDMLLIDVSFPGNPKEGMDFLTEIKHTFRNIRVVVYTGHPETHDSVVAVRDLFAADYIEKSFFNAKDSKSFFTRLHAAFDRTPLDRIDADYNSWEDIKRYLDTYDMVSFENAITSLFASIPNNVKVTEAFFHSNIHLILKGANIKVISEVETNRGRIDAVAETKDYIYLFEFKLSSTAVALAQIKDREYFQMYQSRKKQIILVGVSCDGSKKNISGLVHEKFKADVL